MHNPHRGIAFLAVAAWASQPGVQSRVAQISRNIANAPLDHPRTASSLPFSQLVHSLSDGPDQLQNEISEIFGGKHHAVIHSAIEYIK